MSRLIRAELLRLRSRRLTWIALAAVLLVVALTQLAVYSSVKPLTAAEQNQAQVAFQKAQQEYEQNKEQLARDAEACVAQGAPREDCEYRPRIEDFAQRSVIPFSEVAGLSVTTAVFLSALALLMLSASLVGAEFSSGALANWLSFVPERTKVYASKLVALLVAGVAGTALLTGATIGVTVLLTRIAGAEVDKVAEVLAMGGRGLLLAVIAVVLGFGLAMLTRHTIAAAGTVLGYLLLSFVLTIVMFSQPGLQVLKRVLPENNALALLENGHRYTNVVNTQGPDGQYNFTETEHVITFAQGSLYWAVVLVAVLAVSYLVFRRRDVN